MAAVGDLNRDRFDDTAPEVGLLLALLAEREERVTAELARPEDGQRTRWRDVVGGAT
jgi:hypothetical protein